MSGYSNSTPDPTLVIQATHAWCLNCKEKVSNPFMLRHALVDASTMGCGIEFEYVTTFASTNKQAVLGMRDDLEWRDVEWNRL